MKCNSARVIIECNLETGGDWCAEAETETNYIGLLKSRKRGAKDLLLEFLWCPSLLSWSCATCRSQVAVIKSRFLLLREIYCIVHVTKKTLKWRVAPMQQHELAENE